MREGWVETTLGQVAEVIMGQSPPGSSYNTEGDGLPFLQGSAEFGPRHPQPVKWCRAPRKLAVPGDLLISVRAPVGDMNQADQRYAIGRGLAVIRGTEMASAEFVALALEHAVGDMAARSSSGMFASITAGGLRELPLSVPPVQEQRRIVDLIAMMDSAVEVARGAALAARALAIALRRRAFETGNWPDGRLADAVEVVMGRQRSPAHAAGAHMVRYLRAANVKDGALSLGDVLQMNFTPDEQERYRLQAGDVLVSEGCGSLDEIGASARWNEDLDGVVCFQNTLLRLRTRVGASDPAFVYQWARWAYESGEFARVAQGTNIFHIGARRAVEMRFPRLALETQVRLGSEIESLDTVGAAQEVEIASLLRLRHALLTSLLSGAHTIPASYDRFLEGVA